MGSGQNYLVNKSGASQFREVDRASNHSISQRLSVIEKTAKCPLHFAMRFQVSCDSLAQSARSDDKDVPYAPFGKQAALVTLCPASGPQSRKQPKPSIFGWWLTPGFRRVGER